MGACHAKEIKKKLLPPPANSGGIDWSFPRFGDCLSGAEFATRILEVLQKESERERERERAILAKLQAPRLNISEPESMQLHTPSHSILQPDSLPVAASCLKPRRTTSSPGCLAELSPKVENLDSPCHDFGS